MKEMIIDGVDVSDCRLRQYNSDLCNGFKMDNSGFHQGHCKQNPNCYYKQLKRIEQENVELKAENERLKIENETYDREEYYYYNLSENYRQTLQEIKEIAEDGTKTEDYLLGQTYTDLIDKILNLITKAEVGE